MMHLKEPDKFNPKFEVVSCFVECKNKILLLHRQDHKRQGNTWGVPAGKVDLGEEIQDAMVRELFEETGIKVKSQKIKYNSKHFVRYLDYDFIYHIFHLPVKEIPEVIIRPEEHKSYTWQTPQEALLMNLIQDLDSCIKLFYKLEFRQSHSSTRRYTMFRQNDHWLQEEHDETLRCDTFKQLAGVGIRILGEFKLKSGGKKVVMLSGPMTTGGLGTFEANMHVFGHCVDIARENGLRVFNQLPFQTAMIRILNLPKNPTFTTSEIYPQTILDDFYWPLMQSGGIDCMYFLPTWETSNGATQEWQKAAEIGKIEIWAYEKAWYAETLERSRIFLGNLQVA